MKPDEAGKMANDDLRLLRDLGRSLSSIRRCTAARSVSTCPVKASMRSLDPRPASPESAEASRGRGRGSAGGGSGGKTGETIGANRKILPDMTAFACVAAVVDLQPASVTSNSASKPPKTFEEPDVRGQPVAWRRGGNEDAFPAPATVETSGPCSPGSDL